MYSDKAIGSKPESDKDMGLQSYLEAPKHPLVTDFIILNHGQVSKTAPKLAHTLQTSLPRQHEGVELCQERMRVTAQV
ncbi:hypothetical protein TNCV_4403831 [Trichonephila clavipes]|uniref:Uncharacterized protein n=1 Tax=Trichonephila clavipes TaxID=2585209 RepID=A0A8X6S4R3_TRICX|nr:hypothetical protein TNCV_4403831 [Trichonephila clavipes]